MTDINLIDEESEKSILNESAISDFINFCHKEKIKLTKNNSPTLHTLAKKYIVPPLIETTRKFILTHQKEVVVELFILNQNNDEFTTEEYEDIISQDLLNYVKDDRLLLLPIPVLYRIMSKSRQQSKTAEPNEQYDQNITEFLFKCLDHFGRPASVLFSQYQIKDTNHNFLTRLHKDYSTKFDFHYINEETIKCFYNEESNFFEMTFNMKNELEEMKKEKEETGRKVEEQKEEIRKLKEEQEKMAGEIELLKQMQGKQKEEKEKEIERLKQDDEERISRLRSDFAEQLESLKSQIKDLTEKLAAAKKKQEEKRTTTPSTRTRFSGSPNCDGLIAKLGGGVSLSAAGYPDLNAPVTNIESNDDNHFYNYFGKVPTTESESIIKFDFGSSRRVDLHSYFIRSNCNGPTSQHPKSWRIEGSNDDRLWTTLDRRLNDNHLRGSYKEHNFECQENRHLEHSRFRYIRYVQQDSWSNGCPYYVWITYFELYGDVFNA